MMISQPQYRVLVPLLAVRLPAAIDGGIAAAYVGPEAAARMPAAPRLEIIAKWMIDEVLRQPTPDRFIYVVHTADDQQGGIASLVELAASLEANPSLWKPLGGARLDWALDADPLAVSDGRPFVDRRGFRQLLPRLGAADTPSCVLVTGDQLEGKSYLNDFCRAFATSRGDMKIGYARATSRVTYSDSPRNIVTTLAFDLDAPINEDEPLVHPEPERDAENLASWIARYIPERPVPALAILDEFGRAGVKEAYHRFIIALARNVQTDPRVARRLRVVLIDYDKDRLLRADIAHEHYVLEPVEAPQIADWFRRQYPGQLDIRYESAGKMIESKVLAKPRAERMEFLNNKVRDVCRAFDKAQ
jgi:hypothetical protein